MGATSPVIAPRAARFLPPGLARATWLAALLVLLLGAVPGDLAAHPVGAGWVARLTPGGAATTGGWPTYHGSENRSGAAVSYGPVDDASKWVHCLTSGGTTPSIRTGPVSDGSTVVVVDVFGFVLALNASGSVLWNGTVGPGPIGPEIVAGEVVVPDAGGYLTALALTNGAKLWTARLAAPAVEGLAASGSDLYVATQGGELVALNASTGAVLWSTSLGGAAGGAPAIEGAGLFTVTANGTVAAWDLGGNRLWQRSVGANVTSAVAVSYGEVLVADRSGNVSALGVSNGTVLWRFDERSLLGGDSIDQTPAVGMGGVFYTTEHGWILGLSARNGSLRWATNVPESGYSTIASPLLSLTTLYAIDADEELDAIDPATGHFEWQYPFSSASYASPDLDHGTLYVADDGGCVDAFGHDFIPPTFAVTGTVLAPDGVPVAGANVSDRLGGGNTTDALGRFTLELPNGTFTVVAAALGYPPASASVTVAGGPVRLTIDLVALATFSLTGTVVSSATGAPVVGASVGLVGAYGYASNATTDSAGAFRLPAPNGSDFLSVGAAGDFAPFTGRVVVAGTPVHLEVTLQATTPLLTEDGVPWWGVVVPLGAVGAGAAAFYGADLRHRQARAGLAPQLLSPLGRFVVMRLVLAALQLVGFLFVLFAFSAYLPAIAYDRPPSGFDPTLIAASCGWSSPLCSLSALGLGFGHVVYDFFTGAWGTVVFKGYHGPALGLIAQYLPGSVELALVALAISAALAYPLGLLAGWRRERAVDFGVRAGSTVGLLLPTFAVILFVFAVVTVGFDRTVGDVPAGLLPSSLWFHDHGGTPSWVTSTLTTTPTHLPLVDALLHGDLSFAAVVAAKLLVQAAVIAVVYVAVFLRFARHTVAAVVREPYVVATRARGVDEHTLLWRHAARRAIPVFVLIFGVTLPIYLGTQTVVELISGDNGVGYLFITELNAFTPTFAGYAFGQFYQVLLVLVFLAVLAGNLLADVVARWLDPRLLAGR